MNRLPRKERINHNNRFFIDPRPREREREREKPGFHQFCQDLYQPSNRKIGRGCGSRFQKTKKEPRDNPVEWKHPRWLSDPANTPVYKYSQWPIWPSLFHPLTLHPSSRPTEDSSFCFFSSFRSIFSPWKRGWTIILAVNFEREHRFQIPRGCDTIKVEVASSLRLTRHLHPGSSAVNSVPRSLPIFFLLFLAGSWKNSHSFISFLIIIFAFERYIL